MASGGYGKLTHGNGQRVGAAKNQILRSVLMSIRAGELRTVYSVADLTDSRPELVQFLVDTL